MSAPCMVCERSVRGSRGLGLCSACVAVGERAFRREHSPLDADWSSARSLFFGNRAVLIPAIVAERGGLVGVS